MDKSEEERWGQIIALDTDLLKGGVILSEWCAFIVREADTAFAKGAFLASILTSVSGIETYLRAEYSNTGKENLFKLIDESPIDDILKSELHELRKYRNKWVHVEEPWDDESILESPEIYEQELSDKAYKAMKLLRKTIYENQWV